MFLWRVISGRKFTQFIQNKKFAFTVGCLNTANTCSKKYHYIVAFNSLIKILIN
jgi:hypothetical protein